MHIKKSLPRDKFSKISNDIWTNSGLSDGAKVMYGFLVSLPNGKTIHDGYISKMLNISPRTVTNRKDELKKEGLLLMVKLAPNVHDLFIGFPSMPAYRVKQLWDDEQC